LGYNCRWWEFTIQQLPKIAKKKGPHPAALKYPSVEEEKMNSSNIRANATSWLRYLFNPFDPYGAGMHFTLGVIGFFVSMVDPIWFGVRPYYDGIGFLLVACIIGPFTLAFASIDKKRERMPLFFLMGGFTSGILSFAGITAGVWYMAVRYGVQITEGSPYGVTYIWCMFVGLAVYFSYTSGISAMSRDYRRDSAAPVLLLAPFAIQCAVNALVASGALGLSDDFVKALSGMTTANLNDIEVDGKHGKVSEQVLIYLHGENFEFTEDLHRDLLHWRAHLKGLMKGSSQVGVVSQDYKVSIEQMIARVRSHALSRGRGLLTKR